MIPSVIDPALHDAEPAPRQLDDGFSPPHHDEPAPGELRHPPAAETEPMLGDISPF